MLIKEKKKTEKTVVEPAFCAVNYVVKNDRSGGTDQWGFGKLQGPEKILSEFRQPKIAHK